VVSFDGKTTWTSTQHGIPGAKASTSGAVPLWSFTSLRAALTSSQVAPCLDQELIAAKQGEAPAFRVLFPRVCRNFGGQFQVVTGDAGLMCRENAMLVVGHGKHYLFALKGNHGKAHDAAVAAFIDEPGFRARADEQSHGKVITRELFTCAASNIPALGIFGAQQVWCVRQTSWPNAGPSTVETRYFVSSLPSQTLSPSQQLALVRLHWGIENNQHWTMDAMLSEDDISPCQASKDSIEVVAWLRLLGYNLLAAWRARALKKDRLPLSWARTMELLRDLMVASLPKEPLAVAA
jgi:predicted transposase YbfD/YdcC